MKNHSLVNSLGFLKLIDGLLDEYMYDAVLYEEYSTMQELPVNANEETENTNSPPSHTLHVSNPRI